MIVHPCELYLDSLAEPTVTGKGHRLSALQDAKCMQDASRATHQVRRTLGWDRGRTAFTRHSAWPLQYLYTRMHSIYAPQCPATAIFVHQDAQHLRATVPGHCNICTPGCSYLYNGVQLPVQKGAAACRSLPTVRLQGAAPTTRCSLFLRMRSAVGAGMAAAFSASSAAVAAAAAAPAAMATSLIWAPGTIGRWVRVELGEFQGWCARWITGCTSAFSQHNVHKHWPFCTFDVCFQVPPQQICGCHP